MNSSVIVQRDDAVLRVSLDRPDALNAVDAAMLEVVRDAVVAAGEDPGVRVVVLTGAGGAFSSGADIGGSGGAVDAAILAAGEAAVRAIVEVGVPVVAVVRGAAAGIGVSLALACDLVVAADDAYFLLAFTRIGLMPDGGATALVAASVGRARALRMALLGERLPAVDAHAHGLVSHVVAADALDDVADDIVRRLSGGPTRAYAATKRAVNDATLAQLHPALGREATGQLALATTDDFREGVAAFRERRPAHFTGR